MPATSRSGERFRRRSGSGRAGSPSKSSTTQPREDSIVWPRCRSPWVRITRPPTVACASSESFSRTSWPRPWIGAVASVSGRSRKTRSICSSTSAYRIESDSADGSTGAKSGSELSLPSAVCSSPMTTPRSSTRSSRPSGSVASSSSVSSHPSWAPARNSCRIPSVADTWRPSTSYQPFSAAMCGKPRGGQEAQQLELRVHARLDPPDRLHDQLVAEHDRRVGLLDADRADRQ